MRRLWVVLILIAIVLGPALALVAGAPPNLTASDSAVASLTELRVNADRGVASAQYQLGRILVEGDGVASQPAAGIDLLRKAAAQGHGQAMHDLGSVFRNGKGVPVDLAEAVRWYRQGAEHGNTDAQYDMGWILVEGCGVATDAPAGFSWMQRAADRGDRNAQWYLASLYHCGNGVATDPVLAVTWYRRAAEQGESGAQYTLAQCYESGWGVASNTKEALRWYRLAIEGGHRPAIAARKELAVRTAVTFAQTGSATALAELLAGFGGDPQGENLRDRIHVAVKNAGCPEALDQAIDEGLARFARMLAAARRSDLATPAAILARVVDADLALRAVTASAPLEFREIVRWRALRAIDRDDDVAAAALFRSLAAVDPSDAVAWAELAWRLNRQQKYAAAEAVLAEALADRSRFSATEARRLESVRSRVNLGWERDAEACAWAQRVRDGDGQAMNAIRTQLRGLILQDRVASAVALFESLASGTHRDLPDQTSAASLAQVARVAVWLVYHSPLARPVR